MERDDVQRSYHSGTVGLPMVNVKDDQLTPKERDLARVDALADHGLGPEHLDDFVAWADKNYCPDWHEWGAEACWSTLADCAHEIYHPHGYRVLVHGAGRNSGWACVNGLPDLDGWDGHLLGLWARFCEDARACADDLEYQVSGYAAEAYAEALGDWSNALADQIRWNLPA